MALDQDQIVHIANLLMQNYGDVLKVSRSRGVTLSLPQLRKALSETNEITSLYEQMLIEEIDGQGLSDDALVRSLRLAQVDAFEKGDHTNSTQYSDELKKLITAGVRNRDVGEVIDIGDMPVEEAHDWVMQILYYPNDVDLDKVPEKALREAEKKLLANFELFNSWAFQIQMGFPFQKQDFHSIIFSVCDEIIAGDKDRVIINIPPRHSKTQIFSITLPLFSFCKNPGSHNIITSYAEDVVGESSGYIRQVLTDPLFSKVFNKVRIDPNKRSLDRWGTTKAGVMHAVPTGGRLTGKGAGSLTTVYSGCFVVDDSLKPADAYSDAKRNEVNDRFDNTFMSRLANDGVVKDVHGVEHKCPRTPMVIIMQRLHQDDLVGFLLKGGSVDKYHYLNIPAIITPDVGTEEWYKKSVDKHMYTHATPILYDLQRGEGESALWPSRKSLETLQEMRRTNPYTFNSQYAGDPTAEGIGMVKDEWVQDYEEPPFKEIVRTFMTADTASTVKTYSDYSVICFWGLTKSKDLYLLDVELGKFETPELKTTFEKFWKKHSKFNPRFPRLLPKALYMEDKSSGQYLNQQYIKDGKVRVIPIKRGSDAGDKVARFMNTVPYFAQGRIFFPKQHEHYLHITREIKAMTGLGNGTGHDDVCDNVSDACEIAYGNPTLDYTTW